MDFNFLYKEIENISGDINERYFIRRDNGYKYSSFYEYKLAKNAKTYFGELVKQLDSRDPNTGKGKYTYDKEREQIDYAATAANKGPYAQKFLLLDEKWDEYKQTHLDEFEEQERIQNTDTEELGLSEFRPNIKCSLEAAIQAYWCAGELLKKYDKGTDEYEQLPKVIAYISKDDFKEKHNNVRNQLRQELGIPDEDQLKVVTKQIRTSLKGGRHPEPTDDSMFEEYSNEFTKFLLEDRG